MAGMREAQLAKHKPDKKNMALTEMRSARRDVVTGCKAESIGIVRLM